MRALLLLLLHVPPLSLAQLVCPIGSPFASFLGCSPCAAGTFNSLSSWPQQVTSFMGDGVTYTWSGQSLGAIPMYGVGGILLYGEVYFACPFWVSTTPQPPSWVYVNGYSISTTCLTVSNYDILTALIQSVSSYQNCAPCVPGFIATTTGQTTCTACGAGTYVSNAGASVCQSCVADAGCTAGQAVVCISNLAPSCSNCPAGSFTASGVLFACVGCPAGTYAANPSSSACATCALCPAGAYMSVVCGGPLAGTCSLCPAGAYTRSSNNMTACVSCATGTFANGTGLTGCSNCSLYVCTPGTYIDVKCGGATPGTCPLCPPGTYTKGPNMTACTNCATGTFANGTGLTGCANCSLYVCAPGTFRTGVCGGNYSGCSACGLGSYSAKAGAANCTACSNGTYATQSGMSACLNCSICTAGNFWTISCNMTNNGTCSACAPASYSSTSGTTSCIACANGTFANQSGMSVCQNCSLCKAGNFLASPCGGSVDGTCLPCATGFYSASAGLPACTACPNGTYSNQSGITACTNCSLCRPGSFYAIPCAGTTNGSCAVCPSGSYSASAGLLVCPACAGGTYANQTGMTSCLNCSLCSAGTIVASPCGGSINGSCSECAQGTYAAVKGLTVCSPCPPGAYAAATRQAACALCTTRTYAPYSGMSACLGCTGCPAGSFTSASCGGSAVDICSACPSGSYTSSASGNSACTACGAGSYALAAGATACIGCPGCPTGQYVTVVCGGSTLGSCAACGVGTYPVSTTAMVCTTCQETCSSGTGCAAGFYACVPQFTVCTACAIGTFSTGIGMLDSVEMGGTYSFSSLATNADCQTPALDAEGGWCPANALRSWIQLDLGQTQTVKGVIMQGRATAAEWVTSFTLSYSLDAVLWTALATPLTGNVDSYSRVLAVAPCTARYLQLTPTAYNQWPSLRWAALVQLVPCSTCLPGKYSQAINVSTCLQCATVLKAHADFTVGCSWQCNVGYYNASSGCTQCSNSSACLAGQFRPPCTDGLTNTQGCTGLCTNRAQHSQALYLGPSTDNTATGCPWGCNAGFYKDSMVVSCTACAICGTGKYLTFSCSTPTDLAIAVGPTCAACTLPSLQAIATGPGTQPSNASSCPFTCNAGYWGPTCQAWTATCTLGYLWGAGTSTSDATCTACPYQGLPAYSFSAQNQCSFTCGVGYELFNGICQQCKAGFYKNTSAAIPCVQCGAATYQNSPGSPSCLSVPLNAINTANFTNFACNGGYMRVLAAPPTTLTDSCGTCPSNPVNNSLSMGWSGCTLVSLSCASGYYRNWTQGKCLACQNPSNSAVAPFNASSFCASCTTVLPAQDMLVGCPFACNSGYFGSSCTRCASASCSAGLFAQLCSGGATSDTCTTCPYQLTATCQMWVAQCQWQCLAGYSLGVNNSTCAACSVGKYKTGVGNQSCSSCAAGAYAASTISCVGCAAGTYTDTPLATVCIPCPSGKYQTAVGSLSCSNCAGGSYAATTVSCCDCAAGTYNDGLGPATACTACQLGRIAALGGASACQACTVSWPHQFASTSTLCAQCPWSTPFSANGSACGTQPPPCAAGYYVPYSGTTCLLCPQGTFCAAGQPPAFCPGPYSAVPSVSAADCISTEFLNPLTACPAYMIPP